MEPPLWIFTPRSGFGATHPRGNTMRRAKAASIIDALKLNRALIIAVISLACKEIFDLTKSLRNVPTRIQYKSLEVGRTAALSCSFFSKFLVRRKWVKVENEEKLQKNRKAFPLPQMKLSPAVPSPLPCSCVLELPLAHLLPESPKGASGVGRQGNIRKKETYSPFTVT